MKTKMVFGLLAVLVAAAAISTVAFPALASAADAGGDTDPIVPDATPVQGTAQTRQCAANCTQAQSRIRAMDGSCGLCNGTCTGGGSQYRYGQQQAGAGQAAGTGLQNRGRARTQACLAPTA